MLDAGTDDVRGDRSELPHWLGPPWLWVATWLVSGLVLNAVQLWIFQWLWVFSGLVFAAHALWGVWLAGWYRARATGTNDRKSRSALYAMLFLLPALALLSLSPVLGTIGTRAVFLRRQSEYDRVVQQVAAGAMPAPLSWSRDNREAGFAFNATNPQLIVFRWFNGVPDGGSAIVYDATDSVGHFPGIANDRGLRELEGLLGGDLMACERFASPHYFMCHFS